MGGRDTRPSSEAVVSCLIDSAETKLRMCEQAEDIAAAAKACVDSLKHGHKILLCGNGGSAADAQHIAAEFVSRFNLDRAALPALALTVDTSILTACGNDYGFEQVFARQVEAFGAQGDVLIGISTSGASPNVLLAMAAARRRRMVTIAMCGLGGTLRGLGDHVIAVPSQETPRIQEAHITAGHIICGLVEEAMFGGSADAGANAEPIPLSTRITA